MVIQPQTMRYCKLAPCQDDRVEKSIYIEGGNRGPQMYIPNAATSQDGYLPVSNTSDRPLVIKKNQIIARGYPMEMESDIEEINVRKTTPSYRTPYTLNDLEKIVDKDLSADLKNKLLTLINTYRDCFAEDTSELGRAKDGHIEIKLYDNQPVVYRPYRLSYKEREFVKNQIEELKEYGLIRDSNSP